MRIMARCLGWFPKSPSQRATSETVGVLSEERALLLSQVRD